MSLTFPQPPYIHYVVTFTRPHPSFLPMSHIPLATPPPHPAPYTVPVSMSSAQSGCLQHVTGLQKLDHSKGFLQALLYNNAIIFRAERHCSTSCIMLPVQKSIVARPALWPLSCKPACHCRAQIMQRPGFRVSYLRVMLSPTFALMSSSLISSLSQACSSAPTPSRKPLKKSLVLANIILVRMLQPSGALSNASSSSNQVQQTSQQHGKNLRVLICVPSLPAPYAPSMLHTGAEKHDMMPVTLP